jgi:hypothetical protein
MSFIREQLNPPNSTNFQFREVSCVIVRDLIDGLKNSNCNDIYDLNVNLIKTIKNVIISPLTKLVNLCIRDSTFCTHSLESNASNIQCSLRNECFPVDSNVKIAKNTGPLRHSKKNLS